MAEEEVKNPLEERNYPHIPLLRRWLMRCPVLCLLLLHLLPLRLPPPPTAKPERTYVVGRQGTGTWANQWKSHNAKKQKAGSVDLHLRNALAE